MKNIFICLVFLQITILSMHHAEARDPTFKELHKKSAHGFYVPYVLRYDPETWSCTHKGPGQELQCLKGALKVIVRGNKEQRNLTQEETDLCFLESLQQVYSNSSKYAGFEIKPSEYVVINGINFLHQSAIVDLVSASVKVEWKEEGNYHKSCVSKKASQEQIDYYIYSGDDGLVSFRFEFPNIITQEDKTNIDELFRGFSFDGSACKGPKGLRAFKTALEFITDK